LVERSQDELKRGTAVAIRAGDVVHVRKDVNR
jgi:hypothetical protein